jgi:Di-haem oxidoreductase, putative peroxidase
MYPATDGCEMIEEPIHRIARRQAIDCGNSATPTKFLTRLSGVVVRILLLLYLVASASVIQTMGQTADLIGKEIAVPVHLQDGREFEIAIPDLISFGQTLFMARWTSQEGQGRPLTKGTGNPLTDPTSPLLFPRNFDRMSGPDANSCAGCHNTPFVGAGGDLVSEVFVLAQRFDFLDFDHADSIPTTGAVDERGKFVTTKTAFTERKTIGMNGAGFIEMLARQITADLQAQRNATPPATSVRLSSKGVSFGTLIHNGNGSWDVSKVEGIPAPSLTTAKGATPSLVIRPFHQVGNIVSVRQFTNNAFGHHHGIQSEERFGLALDPDGDGFVNELTTADITAVTLFQITLSVPGQVIPHEPTVRAAIADGERLFSQIGCATCHIPTLPLTSNNNPGAPGMPGWIYTEPSPYNPTTGPNSPNLVPGPVNYPASAPSLLVDLTSDDLPQPRLKAIGGVVWVPAYTDLKLHNICDGPTDRSAEPLDQNQPTGSPGFFAGNQKFMTRKLWGLYNQGPFGHAGKFTTMREEINLGHNGEATAARVAFQALIPSQQDDVIEFLKSLQILPPGTPCRIVDEHNNCREAQDSQDNGQPWFALTSNRGSREKRTP